MSRKVGTVNGIDHRQYAPKNQFATEMDHFADAVRVNAVLHTPGEEGLFDMKIMEAIYQTAAGGILVRLPLVAGRDTTRGKPTPAHNG